MARIMALDIGDKRIGVALSDATGMLASPLTIVEQATQELAIQKIVDVIRERDVSCIVAGLPYSLNGSLGPQAEKVRNFVTALQQSTTVPIEMRDERFTTVSAIELRKETRKRPGKKTRYDAMAAAVLLQGYLDEKRNPS